MGKQYHRGVYFSFWVRVIGWLGKKYDVHKYKGVEVEKEKKSVKFPLYLG